MICAQLHGVNGGNKLINMCNVSTYQICHSHHFAAHAALPLLQAAQDHSWQMNAYDISQCMRGLANIRLPSRGLVQALVARAFGILNTFNMQVCSLDIMTAGFASGSTALHIVTKCPDG